MFANVRFLIVCPPLGTLNRFGLFPLPKRDSNVANGILIVSRCPRGGWYCENIAYPLVTLANVAFGILNANNESTGENICCALVTLANVASDKSNVVTELQLMNIEKAFVTLANVAFGKLIVVDVAESNILVVAVALANVAFGKLIVGDCVQ